jgi:uncharacterized protein (TIGR03067 family)
MIAYRSLLVGSCLLVLSLSTQSLAEERTKWKYENGYFEKTKDGKWVEHAKDGTFHFEETEQTDKSILLIDKKRKIAVRLEDKDCYVRTGEKGQFKLTYKGGWVTDTAKTTEPEKKGDAKTTEAKKDDAPKKTEAPAKKDDAKKTEAKKDDAAVQEEMSKLEGTYLCVSTEQGSEKGDPETLKKLKLVVKDKKWTVYINDKVSTVATFTIDPTKKPKTIDFTGTMGGDKGKKYLGIYELNGTELKLCIGDPKNRPTKFEAKKGYERQFEVWTRAKD